MTEISFLWGELLFSAVWIIVRAALWTCRRKTDWKREAMLLLMYVNLAVIIRVTFFPFFHADGKVQPLVFDPAKVFPLWVNLVPLVHIAEYDTTVDLLVNIIGNVALFIPSGILLPMLYKRLDSFRKVLAGGACISLCIELMQLPFSSRASDIDDLILNTLGCAIGYGMYRMIKAMFSRREKNADIQPSVFGSVSRKTQAETGADCHRGRDGSIYLGKRQFL